MATVRRAYSGDLMAEWIGATRRWHLYGPGRQELGRYPGSRESIVSFMRTLNRLPTGASPFAGRGKGAAMRRAGFVRHALRRVSHAQPPPNTHRETEVRQRELVLV